MQQYTTKKCAIVCEIIFGNVYKTVNGKSSSNPIGSYAVKLERTISRHLSKRYCLIHISQLRQTAVEVVEASRTAVPHLKKVVPKPNPLTSVLGILN